MCVSMYLSEWVTVREKHRNIETFINLYFCQLPGAAGIGQSLVISAHDNDIGDNARLTYSLQTGNENNSFSISTINSSQVPRTVIVLPESVNG